MKSRVMADLLIGDARFDRSRKPDNIEVSTVAVLGAPLSETTILALGSNTEEAAALANPFEAVSVVASIIAATAVVFPRPVFLKNPFVCEKTTPFFTDMLDRKESLDKRLLTKSSDSDKTIRQQWHWGVSVGLIKLFRWRPDFDTGGDGVITSKEYYDALVLAVVPFFVTLHRFTGFSTEIEKMPQPLFARVSEAITDLAKECGLSFELFVRQLVKQKTKHDTRTKFGLQLCREIRNRYYLTRTDEEQEEMISG